MLELILRGVRYSPQVPCASARRHATDVAAHGVCIVPADTQTRKLSVCCSAYMFT